MERQVLNEFCLYRFPNEAYSHKDLTRCHKVSFRTLKRRPKTVEITALRFHPIRWNGNITIPAFLASKRWKIRWAAPGNKVVTTSAVKEEGEIEAVKRVRIKTAQNMWKDLVSRGYTTDSDMNAQFAASVTAFLEKDGNRESLARHGFTYPT